MRLAAIARRAVVVAGLLITALLAASVGAASASADSGVAPVDSHGISIVDYVLSFNEGAGVFGVAVTPGVTIPAAFATLAFGGFIAMAWLSFTVLNLFLKLDWLNPLVRVAEDISTSISTQFGESFVYYVIGATLMLTVVMFALRNQSGRAWHHVAITLVCMGVGTMIVLPVGEAAHLLKIGRDIAVETGGSVTGQSGTENATAILVDKFVREPNQRWQFGQDLDSLGCGAAYDNALRGVKAGTITADKVKDVPLSCPGGAVGEQMHNFAMNPGGAVWLGFLNPVFMFLVTVLIVIVVVMIAGTAVSAIIHAALVKPGLIAVGTSWGQSFLARNLIDGFTASATTCGLLLLLFVGASISGLVASATSASDVGMLVTVVIMVAMIVGVRRAGKNMRGWKNRTAAAVLPNGVPNAYGPPSKAPKQARRMAMVAAQQATAARRSKTVVRAVASKGAAATAPEVMIPAQAAGAFAQHVVHAAHQHHARQAATYQSVTGAHGSAWGAPAAHKQGSYPTPGGYASAAAGAAAAARALNYSGSPAASGTAATAREMARRSSQKRSQNRDTSGPGAPARAALLRAPASRLGAADVGARTPVGVAASAGATAPAAGPARDRRSSTPSPTSAGRAGAPQALRRAGAVDTARDAARDYRKRRQ